MRPDVEAATNRVAAVRSRLARTSDPDLLGHEIEDVLCEGYAHALAADAWLTESERRLHELIADSTAEIRGRDLRLPVREHAAFKQRILTLRRELESLRHEQDRLRTGSHARSA